MKKILLVEDDTTIGLLLLDFFSNRPYTIIWKRDGLSALDSLSKQSFDLCLLDINMAGMDGFSLAKQIKKKHDLLPFLFITARSMKEDKLKAYELGAEDYIHKPFDPDELLCKIEVILRHTHHQQSTPDEIRMGKYIFKVKKMELSYMDQAFKLTEKEAQILLLFATNPNAVIKREEAVKKIYGKYDYFLGRSFDVFISRLRKLLKEDESVQIENVFRVGFMLRM